MIKYSLVKISLISCVLLQLHVNQKNILTGIKGVWE